MSRAIHREMWDLDNRVVKCAKAVGRYLPQGRYLLTITTMAGVVIDVINASSESEAERELEALGWYRMPPNVAFEIDEASRGRAYDKRAGHEVQ